MFLAHAVAKLGVLAAGRYELVHSTRHRFRIDPPLRRVEAPLSTAECRELGFSEKFLGAALSKINLAPDNRDLPMILFEWSRRELEVGLRENMVPRTKPPRAEPGGVHVEAETRLAEASELPCSRANVA